MENITMATATLADYITLQDGKKRIDGQPNALSLVFDLPSDFVKGTNKAKPILQFKIGVNKPSDLTEHSVLDQENNDVAISDVVLIYQRKIEL